MKKRCQHESYYWYPSPNEAGWQCSNCGHKPGEPAGYSPQLDRAEIYLKAYFVISDAADANLLTGISNSSAADALTSDVVAKCEQAGRYDQQSILLYALELTANEHAEYWKQVGDSILAGRDIRDRCACGKLANEYHGGGMYCHDCGTAKWLAEVEIAA